MCIMRHFMFVKVIKIFRQIICFFNYNLTHLDMYNGLSQVYCIRHQKEETVSIQRVKNKHLLYITSNQININIINVIFIII